MSITITQKEVEDLKNFANEIPTKFGYPLLEFLAKKENELKQEVETKKFAKK